MPTNDFFIYGIKSHDESSNIAILPLVSPMYVLGRQGITTP
jgi:hypothetical protein